MSGFDLRSSQSSYGDPRHFSGASFGAPQPPPTKVLMDGYHGAPNLKNVETPRYNPLNTTHPRSSALLNGNDPVTMYLLTETAMGDSVHYEVLSLEEVEGLKKESKFLSGRLEAAKRKLALETKLRDAAMSLSRLYNSKSARSSEEYDVGGSPKSNRSRRSMFGRNGASSTLDKTDGELAVSTRKCEELSQEVWNLESRVQVIQKRLLEHTAGVLQMTHKGLKKYPKNNVPNTPESLSSHNPRGSIDDFDDRSLYKTSDHLNELSGHGPPGPDPLAHLSQPAVGLDTIQNTEKKLEMLSGQMHDMILQSNPNSDFAPVPQLSAEGSMLNPTATIEAYMAYIENGLGALATHSNSTAATRSMDNGSDQQLAEVNSRLYQIVNESGLPRSRTLPPPPAVSNGGLEEHLSYLNEGIDGLHERLGGLLEQKGILTTQIQQQRELNSKSDAERDAHIADLVEQLARVRKELDLAEREGEQSKDVLEHTMEQLEAARRELSDQQHRAIPEDNSEAIASEKEARTRADAEVSRLQTVVKELQQEKDALAEAHEARLRAETEITQLQAVVHEHQREKDAHNETQEAHRHAESEISRLKNVVQELQHEKDAYAEAHEARLRAEAEVARLQPAIQAHQREKDAHAETHEARLLAEAEITRLQAIMQELQQENATLAEAHEARVRAETEVARLESQLEQIRSESNGHTEQLSAVRSEADGEIARLQAVIDQLRGEVDVKTEEVAESRERSAKQISSLEESIQQIRTETDARLKEATDSRTQAEDEITRLQTLIEQIRSDVESQLGEAAKARADAEENAARLQAELTELEGEVVRVRTELTMAQAELDGAYGSRSQRAAAVDPALQKELEVLTTRNIELAQELATFKAGKPANSDTQRRVETLEKELRETIDDYEVMTKASIEFEKEREKFESLIDALRDRCEQLETQLNEERITWMGMHSASMGRDGTTYETTSTMVLKNEFKKMMRDTRTENMKILKAEQEERRRLEALLRNLKKEQASKADPNQSVTAL
ncbi:involucrin repeat protein [Aspergillus nomiae NRRL 13137]|uniref:Involucrin repeat protein n=1 Tax=Aspergillus nomiae NRRL (strain ATCC 15546 / NRRL 13137 / CBS 260.88 / M93) TaxID=1509407 RepID=A0A0L1J1M6_ASPN3|nr:involucrin repeat protein [Aspergillus nomiae NRRL 13137]KNG85711.1 involucrin repeat protein [Aspergillus nomiae NRRL 13137]